ncbi:MAG: pantoate--beta-alanine ligase [Candidatus Omnitrophota bacterium]
MKIIRSPKLMQRYSAHARAKGSRIGAVPTMGYLHDGHMSLVKRSKRENDITVVSIFVNPAQFGPKEDLNKYPRDFKRDEKLLRRLGVDVLFYPSAREMYPQPYYTYVDVGGLTTGLCGASRPGHFRGVTTIVTKLFNIMKPDIAYVGQKDAQQAVVITRMAQDLNMDVAVKTLPTVREKDGLAMSSRNKYLSDPQRKDAVILYKALVKAGEMVKNGAASPARIKSVMRAMIKSRPSVTRIDYIEIVDRRGLIPVKRIEGEALIALAVRVGKTRLIDNMIVKPKF